MISSVAPAPRWRPKTFAVSKKLIPYATAESMIVCDSASGVSGPKFIVPRQSRLTTRPRWPTCVYSIAGSLRPGHGGFGEASVTFGRPGAGDEHRCDRHGGP